jgi:hypothetical protein
MKHPISGVLGAVALCMAGFAQAASFETLHARWQAEEYDGIVPELLAYRREDGGRTWQVDYMIGTSACHASVPVPVRGRDYLMNVIRAYRDLPPGIPAAVGTELAKCDIRDRTARSAGPSLLIVPISTQATDEPAGVSGKGGYIIDGERKGTANRVAVSPISRSVLRQRLVQSGEEQKAMVDAVARLGAGSRGFTAPGLAVACGPGCAPRLQEEVAACLGAYRQALVGQFDMHFPQRPITVYVPDDPRDVDRAAQTLHGVALPPGTVAYSVTDDLSIVGPASVEGCGSLAHELVHLGIRGNFGDSPAWLEEGLAAEVAVSGLQQARLQLAWSWRDAMLAADVARRPSIAELLEMNWTAFTATDANSMRRVATIHATAAAFVRYLDAQQKLAPVYAAIRDRRLMQDDSQYRADKEIVEAELGKPAAEIDVAFAKWFDQERAKNRTVCHANGPAQGC